MLCEVTSGLWTIERPQRFAGVELGARMTVVRLAGAGLLLHSPVALDAGLCRELAGLGKVRCVVAPNWMHHLHAGDYFDAFPEAKIFASPALLKKRPDLHFNSVLSDAAAPEWAGQLEQRLFAPVLAEAVFFHPASRTLIVTDLVSNVQRARGSIDRLLLRLDGAYQRFAVPRAIAIPIRLRYARLARVTIDSILQWEFDRVIVAHGDILERGGREALRRAWSFL